MHCFAIFLLSGSQCFCFCILVHPVEASQSKFSMKHSILRALFVLNKFSFLNLHLRRLRLSTMKHKVVGKYVGPSEKEKAFPVRMNVQTAKKTFTDNLSCLQVSKSKQKKSKSRLSEIFSPFASSDGAVIEEKKEN